MKKLRADKVKIPAHSKGGAKGNAHDIKYFPDSQPGGRSAPFDPDKPDLEPLATAAKPHSANYFNNWVEYFVNVVGSAVERLNGFQFNLDRGPTSRVKAMSKALSGLANALSGTKSNPLKTLEWPMNTSYTFKWSQSNAHKIGYETVEITVNFEKEPDYEMVVNAAVEVMATDPNIAPLSSSSSYLATSSSG
jgi:hypothetical protein